MSKTNKKLTIATDKINKSAIVAEIRQAIEKEKGCQAVFTGPVDVFIKILSKNSYETIKQVVLSALKFSRIVENSKKANFRFFHQEARERERAEITFGWSE